VLFFAVIKGSSASDRLIRLKRLCFQAVTVTLQRANIPKQTGKFSKARMPSGQGAEMPLNQNAGQVTIEPRGLMLL
jgi:hypothetical protein